MRIEGGLVCSQNWLKIYFLDDHHFGYITKSLKVVFLLLRNFCQIHPCLKNAILTCRKDFPWKNGPNSSDFENKIKYYQSPNFYY